MVRVMEKSRSTKGIKARGVACQGSPRLNKIGSKRPIDYVNSLSNVAKDAWVWPERG